MISFLTPIFKNWLKFAGRRKITKRRERAGEYEVLNQLGREQLKDLKRRGLSIPVIAA